MNQQLLIAHRWKTIGWLLTIPALIAGIYYMAIDGGEYLKITLPPWMEKFMWIDNGFFSRSTGAIEIAILDELICLFLFAGLLLLAFSREKVEDEWIQRVRLESFQWALLVNTLLLMLFVIFAHGFPFLSVMVYNMFTPLLIFVGRYYYILRLKPLFSKD
ncbi:MAG: hypothetical protein JNJ57_05425 [Saprospiraceae bacterium]|nr:hypothetical protein [Saprospiraceae bacterium]